MHSSSSSKNRCILSAIAAMADNRVIGKLNQLPWHLPADLKRFKSLTLNHAIVMGRKTYESIGKPLPQRTNIILTRQPHFSAPGCHIITNIDEAIALAEKVHHTEIFIIGGSEIYLQLLPRIQRIYLTLIHGTFDGDAFFPELVEHEWKETSREQHEADQDHHYAYTFVILDRIANIL